MRGGPGHQDADAWRLACSAIRLLRARAKDLFVEATQV
jgi:hypothetical protein